MESLERALGSERPGLQRDLRQQPVFFRDPEVRHGGTGFSPRRTSVRHPQSKSAPAKWWAQVRRRLKPAPLALASVLVVVAVATLAAQSKDWAGLNKYGSD